VYLKDPKGVRHDIIDACIAMGTGQRRLTAACSIRAKALSETLKLTNGEKPDLKGSRCALTHPERQPSRRIADGVNTPFGRDIKFAETEEERGLFDALDTAEAAEIKPAIWSSGISGKRPVRDGILARAD